MKAKKRNGEKIPGWDLNLDTEH